MAYKRVPLHLGTTIGSLALNEILETALNLPHDVVRPTYVLLDEFQNFDGPDVYDAIPTVRQQGVRLILAHQSFSQLKQGARSSNRRGGLAAGTRLYRANQRSASFRSLPTGLNVYGS